MALTDTKVTFGIYQTLTNASSSGEAKSVTSVTPTKRADNSARPTRLPWPILSEYTTADFLARVDGIDPSAGKLVYSTQDHNAPLYVRNTGCWAYGLRQAMTCISPWNSQGGRERAGTAVTPRHILAATHFLINIGSTIRFITADNQIVTRTVVDWTRINAYPESEGIFYPTDITVELLDEDLPATITPAKIAPLDFLKYGPDKYSWHMPCILLDREEKALIYDFGQARLWWEDTFPRGVLYDAPSNSTLHQFYEVLEGGDSGDPFALFVDDEMILLTTAYSTQEGPSILSYSTRVNNAIARLDSMNGVTSGYQLTHKPLNTFRVINEDALVGAYDP